MRILFLGDIVGKSGRDMVMAQANILRGQYQLDLIIANGENATHGFGLSAKHGALLLQHGIDIITGGNHSFDKESIYPLIAEEKRVLCPYNFDNQEHNNGVFEGRINGFKIKVISILGTVFMKNATNPFALMHHLIGTSYPKKNGLDALIIDIHCETTSEKYALAHYIDGKASFVVGTHTHIPTNDAHILPNGTAFQCDAGMCGDYNSVIGMKKQTIIPRFIGDDNKPRMEVAEGDATLSGIIVETDKMTGLATSIEPLIIGAHLRNQYPAKILAKE